MTTQQQANHPRSARSDDLFPFAARNARKNFNLCHLSNGYRVSSAWRRDCTYPISTPFRYVAFHQGTTVKEVMGHGPSRRSSMIASENNVLSLSFISALISANNTASSMSSPNSSS